MSTRNQKASGTNYLQSPYILVIILSGRNRAAQLNQFLSIIQLRHIEIFYLTAVGGRLNADTSTLKIIVSVKKDTVSVITNYPLKKGRKK